MIRQEKPARWQLRHLDVWGVTKVSLLFFCVVALMFLVAATVLWKVLEAFNLVTKVEELGGSLMGGDFRLSGGQLFRAFLMLDLIFVVGSTALAVILTIVYNLISDVVGGLTFVVGDPVRERDNSFATEVEARLERREQQTTPAVASEAPAAAQPARRTVASTTSIKEAATAGGGKNTGAQRTPNSGNSGAGATKPKPMPQARRSDGPSTRPGSSNGGEGSPTHKGRGAADEVEAEVRKKRTPTRSATTPR